MGRPKHQITVICDLNTKTYLSSREAMIYLDVSEETLNRWRTDGVKRKEKAAVGLRDKYIFLPYYKAGKGNHMIRYKRKELDLFFEEAFRCVNDVSSLGK
ncbi:helix-turn-helix domain-containing protein [Flavobacteriaceae bacterium]|nr:helix-turn-helix domain-containing protein [Flavobacteriaceae bacterium]